MFNPQIQIQIQLNQLHNAKIDFIKIALVGLLFDISAIVLMGLHGNVFPWVLLFFPAIICWIIAGVIYHVMWKLIDSINLLYAKISEHTR